MLKLTIPFTVYTFHCSWQHIAWNIAFEVSWSGHDTGGAWLPARDCVSRRFADKFL